jgi:type IV pilus assembly protein PilV
VINSKRPLQLSRGFSLVEVMVALVVCSVGLLGLAKMESLAISSTGVAGSRSLVAIQASSLAAAMHANPGYWAAGLVPATFTVTVVGGAVQISDPGLNSPATCLTAGSTSCTPSLMAAYDVQRWAAALQLLIPYYTTTVTCTVVTGTPVSCNIQVQWVENAVASNSAQTVTALASLNNPTYVLFVQP